MVLRASRGNGPEDKAPVVDIDPAHPRVPTFKGNGDFCLRCGGHGYDHRRVRFDRGMGWLTHHYLCPDFINENERRINITLLPPGANG